MKKVTLIVLLILVSGAIYAGFFSNVGQVFAISKCTLLTTKVTSTTIPFTIENGWLVIEVEIKGKDGKSKKEKFLLDTGAPTSLMASYTDKEPFKKKGLSMKEVALGAEAQNASNYVLDEPLTFKIGDMEVLQKHTLVNQAAPAGFDCTGAVGLIGSNLLSKFVVSMDFVHSTLTLSNKDGFSSKSLSDPNYKLSFMPLIFQKNPYCSINLNGEDFEGIFDTGFSGDIMLTADSTDEQLNKRKDGGVIRKFETYAALTNIHGIQKTRGVTWLWPQATFTNDDKAVLAKGNISILKTGKNKLSLTMGLNYMRQYDRVVVDWNSNTIYFFGTGVKKQDAGSHIDVRIRHLADEQKYVIGLIDVSSPFYRNGLRAGDVVTRASDTLPASISPTDDCNLTSELNRLTADAESYTIIREGKEIVIGK